MKCSHGCYYCGWHFLRALRLAISFWLSSFLHCVFGTFSLLGSLILGWARTILVRVFPSGPLRRWDSALLVLLLPATWVWPHWSSFPFLWFRMKDSSPFSPCLRFILSSSGVFRDLLVFRVTSSFWGGVLSPGFSGRRAVGFAATGGFSSSACRSSFRFVVGDINWEVSFTQCY